MRRASTHRIASLLLAAGALLGACCGSASAQSANSPNWETKVVMAKYLTVGVLDSTRLIDMTNHHNLSLTIKVNPAAGVAEPWSLVQIRAIGSTTLLADSNATGILQLQPVADHSYSGSASGDSLSYGAWTTGTVTNLGNGVIQVRGARPNSSWAYPHAWTFELSNKGQTPRSRYIYLQVLCAATGGTIGSGSPYVVVTAQKSN